jgi:hypothetical protein
LFFHSKAIKTALYSVIFQNPQKLPAVTIHIGSASFPMKALHVFKKAHNCEFSGYIDYFKADGGNYFFVQIFFICSAFFFSDKDDICT